MDVWKPSLPTTRKEKASPEGLACTATGESPIQTVVERGADIDFLVSPAA